MSMFDRFFKGKRRDRHAGLEPEENIGQVEKPAPNPVPAAPPEAGSGVPAPPPPVEPPVEIPTDTRTPEERCGITPDMDRDAIKEQLAKMFRRYNRLASSLDGDSRIEAEAMLDLIVGLREKYLG